MSLLPITSYPPSSVGTAPTSIPESRPKVAQESGVNIAVDKEKQTDLGEDKLHVEAAVEKLNEFAVKIAQGIQFSVDDETGKTVVKVVDTATNEVLRQLPSKEALSIAQSLSKMQGLLIHEKA